MILIIIPFKNEEKTIKRTLQELYVWCSKNIKDFEILLINDHSSDTTLNQIKEHKLQRVRVVSNRFDRGKGSALKTAVVSADFMYAVKDDDKILFLDGDGQFDYSDIEVFLGLMEIYNADIVIGNKRHLFSTVSYSLKRRIVSSVYNWITRILFGFNFRDTQSGMKLFKKNALDSVLDKVNSKRYAFDLELLVAMREMNFRIIDAPIKISRSVNSGSVRFSTILYTFFDTLIILINKLKGMYA